MSPTFTEDDVGKTVESATGENLGAVVAVDPGTAYVEPEPGMADSIKAVLDWEGDADDAVPLADDSVDRVTDETIRLKAEFPTESITSGAADDERAGDLEGSDRREIGYDPGEPAASDPTDPETDVDGTNRRTGAGDLDESEPMTGNDEFYDSPEGGPRVDPSDEMAEPEAGEPTEAADDAEEMGSVEDEASREIEVDPSELTERDSEAEIAPDEDVGRREEPGDVRDESEATTESTADEPGDGRSIADDRDREENQ
ncbi:hypothetical protein [Natronococcus wangiae]|uniref:hypothetical protein n=1 Tax=Natronococcus wangiae TaxID=3068275 RepID=UPI00273E6180|nr:hypothetical protein [Natronococcus sp. AD5]